MFTPEFWLMRDLSTIFLKQLFDKSIPIDVCWLILMKSKGRQKSKEL